MPVDLTTPLRLPCGVELPNRLLKSAMTEGLADDHDRATGRHETLYRCWARGGTGTLVTGNVMIDRRFLERPGNVVIDGNGGRSALRRWAAAGTSHGNHLWMQISHPGRQCGRLVSRRPMAPSEMQLDLLGLFARPAAMTEADIQDALDRFARVAGIAREAGFTGVQLHAAHGYLISEFLSPLINRRNDAWGGDLAARARFLLEAVRRTRRAVGADFPVAVKLNSADFQKGGFGFSDSIQVVQWLEAAGVDLVEISGGSYEQPAMFAIGGRAKDVDEPLRESTRRREAFFLDFAEQLRAQVKLPLAVTGGFRTRAAMVDALRRKALDVVGLARPLVVEPDLGGRLIQGLSAGAVPHEDRLRIGRGRLGPNSELFLFKALNTLGTMAWYYRQIIRLSEGRAPNPAMQVPIALLRHQTTELRVAWKRRRVLRVTR